MEKGDLLVGERPDFAAVNRYEADDLLISQERHRQHGPDAGVRNHPSARQARFMRLLCGDVQDMNRAPGIENASTDRAGFARVGGCLAATLYVIKRLATNRWSAEPGPIKRVQLAKSGLAKMHGLVEDRIEYRLKIAG